MSEIVGTIIEMYPVQEFASGFSKRELVVNTSERYPQPIKIEFVKEKIDQLEEYTIGDAVKIRYDLRGRSWEGKYFVNVLGWKIERADQQAPQGQSMAGYYQAQQANPAQAAPTQANAPASPAAAPQYRQGMLPRNPEPATIDDLDDEDIPF